MKQIIIYTSFLMAMFSCASDKKEDPKTAEAPQETITKQVNAPAAAPTDQSVSTANFPNDLTADSPEVVAIKSEIDSLNARLKKSKAPSEFTALHIYSKRDQLAFWETDDGYAKLTMRLSGKDFEANPTYYMKDGEIKYYHHRKWAKTGDEPHVREMFVCFDHGQLLYAEERYVAFKEGKGLPAMMMNTPLEKSTRSAEEILANFNEYYNFGPVAERLNKVRSKYNK